MKTILKKNRSNGMTRVELLIIIGITLIGIYLFVRYEKGGEVFQISWRKTEFKKTEVKIPAEMESLPPIVFPSLVTNPGNLQTNFFFTNITKQEINVTDSSSANAEIQFIDQRRQKVLILTNVITNSVWFRAASRKAPGVRIAYP